MTLTGLWHTSSNTDPDRLTQTSGQTIQKSRVAVGEPLSYRRSGSLHKVLIPAEDRALEAQLLPPRHTGRSKKYGAYTLVEISDDGLAELGNEALQKVQVRDDLNLIKLRRGQLDTTGGEPQVKPELRQSPTASAVLHLVQLFGPPTPESLGEIQATGAKIVSYVPNNAYLIWASQHQVQQIRALRAQGDVIQWEGDFHPFYKIDSHIELESADERSFTIEIVDTPTARQTLEQIKGLATKIVMPEMKLAGTIQLKIATPSFRVSELAKLPEVIFIEPAAKPKLHDERAGQILANSIVEETINNVKIFRPSNPGYLTFLNSLGFNSPFDFAIDVADSGFDRGADALPNLHQDFLDANGSSRVRYLHDFTGTPGSTPTHDTDGHGTLNASIAVGYNVNTTTNFRDALGYQYGLGVAPFALLGVSKVFNDNGDFVDNLSFAQMLNRAYSDGARVTNNSWGLCDFEFNLCNLYNSDARAYDTLVRDIDPNGPGYQQMIAVFSAGNDGKNNPLSVAMPASAKNVIAVGASEGFRATDANGNPLTDGCGVTSTSADNAQDVTDFSSGGPLQDGRAKPDLVAPGTHITGAATQDGTYATKPENSLGVCNRFFPAGQSLYTWSTGTSHAAPNVSGGAALAYQWLRARLGSEPSAAIVKAFLLNSTTYLTGKNANDNLPGAKQGWGLMNIARMFETVDRIIYEEGAHLFTQSGGTPFEISGTITDPTKEFRVMLTYSDAAGTPLSNAPYVNQLNLEVTVGGVTYYGNVFAGQYSKTGGARDFLNNVQGVRLPAGTTGTFTIRVIPTIIAGDGAPFNGILVDQDFALVATNGREMPVPVLSTASARVGNVDVDDIQVKHASGSTDRAIIPGETAQIILGVRNSAAVAATISSATLGFAGSSTSVTTDFPTIEANKTTRNDVAFSLQIPSTLRCGAVAELRLRLTSQFGDVTLPFRVLVGRATSQLTLLDDDVDSGRVKWKQKKGFTVATNVGFSGTQSYYVTDPGKVMGDTRLAFQFTKKAIRIPENAGNVRLSFYHIFNFEPGYDGGVIEVSLDDGETWQDIGSRAISGGYDGKLSAASSNPLGTRFAWTSRGQAGVFSQAVLNLDEFAGKTIKLRFVAGFDEATGILDGYKGWFIDNIKITADSVECR
jgi:hypothetical protein